MYKCFNIEKGGVPKSYTFGTPSFLFMQNLNLIHRIVVPLGIEFNEQLYLYSKENRVDRVAKGFQA
ncbi:hypothetical protein BEH_09050 [Priestia filamentosa]|uniref:Uncharacterized protein n=1 Tax=Priestia filamentosa TaxID=1402861 RepID=A0A0H4KVC0_9BACI|nr:hypothetical protein BEH_09050 [Priestia filamentosa]OXS68823.1 hypothetical protein B1B01_07455 [Priestia filamentosa]RJS64475.1 hypothetical protein CJ485_06860 [Priestia filamentosa]